MESIATELVEAITEYLPIEDIVTLSCVSKDMFRAVEWIIFREPVTLKYECSNYALEFTVSKCVRSSKFRVYDISWIFAPHHGDDADVYQITTPLVGSIEQVPYRSCINVSMGDFRASVLASKVSLMENSRMERINILSVPIYSSDPIYRVGSSVKHISEIAGRTLAYLIYENIVNDDTQCYIMSSVMEQYDPTDIISRRAEVY